MDDDNEISAGEKYLLAELEDDLLGVDRRGIFASSSSSSISVCRPRFVKAGST